MKLALLFLVGCASIPASRQAELTYGAELDACVKSASTKAESKACREKVMARWGRLDGGAE